MQAAMVQAESAAKRGEVPVGCIIVDGASGEIISSASNRTEELDDPTAHAEMLAIRTACASVGSARLIGCDMYITLEPCPMCATAISFARIRRVYFGAYDPKSGGVDHGARIFEQPTCHHKPEVYGGINETACGEILKNFFKAKR
ncbi:MAG: nucleoside deaminase [Rhodospirillaceae bacterium]|nr:nucleoside deaminase [Rhodospirillaceae bacterium]